MLFSICILNLEMRIKNMFFNIYNQRYFSVNKHFHIISDIKWKHSYYFRIILILTSRILLPSSDISHLSFLESFKETRDKTCSSSLGEDISPRTTSIPQRGVPFLLIWRSDNHNSLELLLHQSHPLYGKVSMSQCTSPYNLLRYIFLLPLPF